MNDDDHTHDRSGARRRPLRRAFTLVEMLVVLSVIVLLAAILTPFFHQAREIACSSLCKGHLGHLAQTMHSAGQGQAFAVPPANGWVGNALAFGSPEILLCINDEEPRNVSRGKLSDLYIYQLGHDGVNTSSYLVDLLAGRAVPDKQVWIDWWLGGPSKCGFSKVCNCCWDPKDLTSDQHVIGVDGSTAIKLTLGDIIRIEALQTCFSIKDPGGSRHYLKSGPSDPPEDDEEVLHLTGKDYHILDPRSPVELCGARVSYGMSVFIDPAGWRPGQIMLMDAEETMVGVRTGSYGESIVEDVVAPRHMGRVNVVSPDQSVRTMSVADIRDQLDADARGLNQTTAP